MAMSTAAARASSTTASPTTAAASATTAARKRALRAAMAEATATPQRWASESAPPFITDCTLRRMSLPASGMAERSASRACMSGRHQRRLALLPVAGTELARLQRVQHPQHLVYVPSHRQVVDGGKANHPVGVGD